VERENAFFKSSPVNEYHLPQMNSEKKNFGGTTVPYDIPEHHKEFYICTEILHLVVQYEDFFCIFAVFVNFLH
jgi:HSP90 family molecular chaperone